jgi:hypothetical protein
MKGLEPVVGAQRENVVRCSHRVERKVVTSVGGLRFKRARAQFKYRLDLGSHENLRARPKNMDDRGN